MAGAEDLTAVIAPVLAHSACLTANQLIIERVSATGITVRLLVLFPVEEDHIEQRILKWSREGLASIGRAQHQSPVFMTGSFTFGVFGEAKEATVTITNDTPYPVNFVEAEWEGDYTNRSQTL